MDEKRILFVSKYSQHCHAAVQACTQLGLTGIINIIYIDSNEARELIRDAKYINLSYVPTLIIKEDENIKAFVGPKVIQYMKLLYSQLQGQMHSADSMRYSRKKRIKRSKKSKKIKSIGKKPKKKTKPVRKKKVVEKEESSEEESSEEESSEEESSEEESSEEEPTEEEEYSEGEDSQAIEPPVINEKGKVNVMEAMAMASARRDEDLGYSEKSLPYH